MSRPKISRSVQRLQDLMSAVLLVPSNSGIKLTDKGKELAQPAAGAGSTALHHVERSARRDARDRRRRSRHGDRSPDRLFHRAQPGVLQPAIPKHPGAYPQSRQPAQVSRKSMRCDGRVRPDEPCRSGIPGGGLPPSDRGDVASLYRGTWDADLGQYRRSPLHRRGLLCLPDSDLRAVAKHGVTRHRRASLRQSVCLWLDGQVQA